MTVRTTDVDVVVIGAGFAGLIAAHTLHQAGHTVKCFEARDRVGGRASTINVAGLAVELGATWYWHNEPLIQQVLKQLELDSFAQALTGDAMFEPPDQAAQRIRGNPIDGPALRFATGAQSVATALANQLDPNHLSLGDPVAAVEQYADHLVVEAATGKVTTQHLIVAVPPALAIETIEFRPELSAELRAAAAAKPVWMGDMVKAIAIYDSPVWQASGLAGSAISYRGPFQEFHDHSGPDTSGAAAIFGFARSATLPEATDNDIAETFRAQLGRIFGDTIGQPQHIIVTNWANEYYTNPTGVGSVGTSPPLTVLDTPGDKRIRWASTETADAFSGHIEGALRAGLAAARGIQAW